MDKEGYSQGEFLKVQEALDKEQNFIGGVERNAINANMKLLVYEDCICRAEFKLSRTICEKDMVISDLMIELI